MVQWAVAITGVGVETPTIRAVISRIIWPAARLDTGFERVI